MFSCFCAVGSIHLCRLCSNLSAKSLKSGHTNDTIAITLIVINVNPNIEHHMLLSQCCVLFVPVPFSY